MDQVDLMVPFMVPELRRDLIAVHDRVAQFSQARHPLLILGELYGPLRPLDGLGTVGLCRYILALDQPTIGADQVSEARKT